MRAGVACILALGIVGALLAAQQPTELRIEKMMSAQELKETGVAGLTEQQRGALSRWLLRYTRLVASSVQKLPAPETGTPIRSSCSPAIETTIAGEFEGWSGETIFKLDNGQIWEQAEYDYMYSYQYRPDVTIYLTRSGCRMKIEGEEETILVRRIK
jgi:hypothetical protein